MCDKKFSIPKEFIKNNKRVYKLAETADFIIEVVDARIAHSGANLLNYAKLNDVKRIILFSNTQKADVEQTKKWMEYYHSQEIYCQMLLCHEEQTSKEYKRCLANFKKLLKKYANKKILIISLPDSNKELLLEKIFDNNETFEKERGIFFTREKIYRYNNVEFIDTVPITGINFFQPDVYWNTQILGLFKIEDNTEIVAIKAFQLLLTKYQKKLETAYSVRIQPKSSVKQIVKEFIKLMTTNLSLPDSETTDNLLLCAKFLEDIKKGRKFPQFHWNELKIMLNNFYLKW